MMQSVASGTTSDDGSCTSQLLVVPRLMMQSVARGTSSDGGSCTSQLLEVPRLMVGLVPVSC